ncbi:GGDEF domain-containing protein, partial [Pseudomonas sp. SIMBA_059]
MTGLDPRDEIAHSVRTDRLKQLFVQSAPAVLGSYLAAIMLCWLGWERFDQQKVVAWMAVLSLSTALRTAMF